MKVGWRCGAVALLVACGGSEADGGRLDVSVTSPRDTVRFAVRARAHWCATDSSLEILGTRGDSGVAIALFPADSTAPGAYVVVGPDQALTPRPRARVAARWFGRTLVEGYYSVSGVVNLSGGTQLSGDVTATLQGFTATGQEEIRGTFRGLTVHPADLPCGGKPDSVRVDAVP